MKPIVIRLAGERHTLVDMARTNRGKVVWYKWEHLDNCLSSVQGYLFLSGIMFGLSFEKAEVGHNIVLACECNGQKCRGFAGWFSNKTSVKRALSYMTECIKYARN